MVEEGNDDSVERPSMSSNYLSASLSLVPLDARKCNFIAVVCKRPSYNDLRQLVFWYLYISEYIHIRDLHIL